MWIRVHRTAERFLKNKTCKPFSTEPGLKNIDMEVLSKYVGVKLWGCPSIKYGVDKERAKVA